MGFDHQSADLFTLQTFPGPGPPPTMIPDIPVMAFRIVILDMVKPQIHQFQKVHAGLGLRFLYLRCRFFEFLPFFYFGRLRRLETMVDSADLWSVII